MTGAEVVLAHHALVAAVPFVLPSALIPAVLVVVVARDRRSERKRTRTPD